MKANKVSEQIIAMGVTPSPIQAAPVKKKIGFVSAILLVIGSSIGSGIFIKNHEMLNHVHGAVFYVILAWVIAIIGILALAMALPEICSGIGANNQGLVGWVRKFNHKFFYMGAKNFMTYLHLPIYYFIMPLYMVMTLQETFGFSIHWYWVILISLAISTWFVWISGLSARAANIQNWVVTCVKFLPLLFAAVAGFVMVGLGHGGATGGNDINWFNFQDDYDDHLPFFSDKLPFLGVLSSIPAVFFAFDGFYSAAGVQSEMKEPRKVSMALAVGIAIVSAIDIIISFSFLIGTKSGRLSDLEILMEVKQVANVLVTIGILGIINGVAVYSSRYYEDLVKHNEIPFAWKWKEYVRKDSPFVGCCIGFVIMLFWFIIFTVIGFFFINSGHYNEIIGWDNRYYDPEPNGENHLGGYYSFADIIGNWNAVLAFACIIFAVLGAVVNRKTKQVKVTKSKTFLFGGIVSTIIVGVGLLTVVMNSVGNFVYVIGYYDKWISYPDWYLKDGKAEVNSGDVIGCAFEFIVSLSFLGIMFIPAAVRVYWDKKKNIHKYSHQKY